MWLQRALEQPIEATAARAKVLVGAGRLAWFQGELRRGNRREGSMSWTGGPRHDKRVLVDRDLHL
jgi:hypothetical protein